MNKNQKIAMVILAAGASKRTNTIKQLLPWKSTTLLGNAIEQGFQSNVDSVYVVLGANSEVIRESISDYEIQIIENKNWKRGLGSSIACVVNYFNENALNYNALLITLADQPLVNTVYYNLLIEQFSKNKERIITSKTNNKPSVPAIFDASYFEKLSELNQDIGAKSIIKAASIDVFMVEVVINLVDVDTLKVYEKVYNDFGRL